MSGQLHAAASVARDIEPSVVIGAPQSQPASDRDSNPGH